MPGCGVLLALIAIGPSGFLPFRMLWPGEREARRFGSRRISPSEHASELLVCDMERVAVAERLPARAGRRCRSRPNRPDPDGRLRPRRAELGAERRSGIAQLLLRRDAAARRPRGAGSCPKMRSAEVNW